MDANGLQNYETFFTKSNHINCYIAIFSQMNILVLITVHHTAKKKQIVNIKHEKICDWHRFRIIPMFLLVIPALFIQFSDQRIN